jgi:hypothetical protein
MALPNERRHALLRVLEGGRSWRAADARVELLTFFGEVADDAAAIQSLEAQMAVPNLRVIHLAGRIGHRATVARREYLELTSGPDAA